MLNINFCGLQVKENREVRHFHLSNSQKRELMVDLLLMSVIRCFFVRDNFINLTEGNERYILDATIYTLMMFSVIPMMY